MVYTAVPPDYCDNEVGIIVQQALFAVNFFEKACREDIICPGEGGPSRKATRPRPRTRARVLQETRPLWFAGAGDERWQQRILTRTEAGEMRGVTERPLSRGGDRGGAGSTDRPALSPCRAGRCGAAAGASGHVTRASLRKGHRKPQPRTPLPGMLLPQDGSTHAWSPGCQGDVLRLLDEATSDRLLRGGRRVSEQPAWAAGGHPDVGALEFPVCGSGHPLLVHGGGRWQRGHESADPGASRAATTGPHADFRLFAGSAGSSGG